MEVEAFLKRRYEGQICDIEIVNKEDLALVRHIICHCCLCFVFGS